MGSRYNATQDIRLLSRFHKPSIMRIRSYTARLLETRQLDELVLEFAICTLLPSAQQRLARIMERHANKDDTKDFSARDGSEMASKLIAITGRKDSAMSLDRLHTELTKGLGKRQPMVVPPSPEMQELASLLDLSYADVEVVQFLYHHETFPPLNSMSWRFGVRNFLNLIADATGLTLGEVLNATRPNGRLRQTGVLQKITPRSSPPIDLEDDVITLLGGLSGGNITDKFFIRDDKPTLNITKTHVAASPKHIVSALLDAPGPVNILLYGVPGTGKTEFARSIAAASGRSLYQVKHPEDSGDDDGKGFKGRRVALTATANALSPDDSILIVDEADTVLNTRYAFLSGSCTSPDKGWLNTFLDSCPHKIIWITNDTQFIEESTMRRFAYSVHFQRPNSRNRYQIWKDLLNDHPLQGHINDDTVRKLSGKYSVTTGGIASVLCTLERVSSDKNQSVDKLLTDLVARHARAIGVQTGNKMQPISAVYDASILNTDVDLNRVVSSVTRISQGAPANCWGNEYGLNLLLWGAPGTGKTAFAQHIAETTGRELLVKRASDILSPFVGATEMQIAQAFEDSVETGAILLIDEADSLIVDRRYARQSWETTQTNELLCQMESFPGMLICCTNLLDKLDGAVLRRFAWKVEFKPLTPDTTIKLCQRYFADIQDWDCLDRTTGLTGVTPGDIKVVWQRAQTTGEVFRSARQVFEAISSETRYKDNPTTTIGFGS